MRFLKKPIIFSLIFVCLLCASGCEKDLRIFKKDITAVVDGQEQPIFYYEMESPHGPGYSDLSIHDSAYSIYSAVKDNATTISGKTHEVTITFAAVKPVFRKEDIRFTSLGRDPNGDPENAMAYGDVGIEFPVTDFQSEKGELKFKFEIDKLFYKDTIMMCIAIWYDYDLHNIFIPMYLPAELVGDVELGADNDNPVRGRPNYSE